MALHPPLREAPRYPATLLIGLIAIVASLRGWFAHTHLGFVPTGGSLLVQPWALVTTIFPHVNVVHLAFNLYWWWTFATVIERVWGSARLVGIVVLLAVISSAAQIGLSSPGMGLSGVGYGLCTLIWVAQRRYANLQGVVTRRVIELFAVWFVVCVVLTLAKVWHIGNVAHGAGAAAGWLLGRAIVATRGRAAWAAGVVGVVAVTFAGATVLRPWVNIGELRMRDATSGHRALLEGRYDEAIPLLEAACAKDPTNAGLLVNLGIAYQQKGRYEDAIGVYTRAAASDAGHREKLAPAIASMLDHQAAEAAKRGDRRAVGELARRALAWRPDDPYAKKILEWANEEQPLPRGDDVSRPPRSSLPGE